MKPNPSDDDEWRVFHLNHARLRKAFIVFSVLGSIAITAAMIFGRRQPGVPPPWRDLPATVLLIFGCTFALYTLYVVTSRLLPVRVSRDGISASTALIIRRFATWHSIESAEIVTLKGFSYLNLHGSGRAFGPMVPMDLHRLGEFIALVRRYAGPRHPASVVLEKNRGWLVGTDGEIQRGPGFWRSLGAFMAMLMPVFHETTIARWVLCGPVALFASHLVWLAVVAFVAPSWPADQRLAENPSAHPLPFLAGLLAAATLAAIGPIVAPSPRRRVAFAFAALALLVSPGSIDLLSGRLSDAPSPIRHIMLAGVSGGAVLGLLSALWWQRRR